jgi:hypothetical protein
MATFAPARSLAIGLLAPVLAFACGACLEDKMAATYDDAVIRQAAAGHRTVVFCDVRGRIAPGRLRAAAAKASGVDRASVRTSTEPAALSFALDTRVQSAQAAVGQINGALRGEASVTWLRSLAPPSGPGTD